MWSMSTNRVENRLIRIKSGSLRLTLLAVPQLTGSSYEVWWRTAALAKPLASALFSRRTWEMENLIERANLRQIKLRE